MIVGDFYLLGLKIGSIQASLTDLFGFNGVCEPVFKRDERYCKNLVNESDDFQTVLIGNRECCLYVDENKNVKSYFDCLDDFDNYLVVDLFGNRVNSEDSGCMDKKTKFKELVAERLKNNFGLEVIDEYDCSNIIFYPDNRFAMIKRVCPHCGAVDANVNKWEERKYKNKENKTVLYYPQSLYLQ